jgi:hypothetical protein
MNSVLCSRASLMCKRLIGYRSIVLIVSRAGGREYLVVDAWRREV